jgi:hypothetical protein
MAPTTSTAVLPVNSAADVAAVLRMNTAAETLRAAVLPMKSAAEANARRKARTFAAATPILEPHGVTSAPSPSLTDAARNRAARLDLASPWERETANSAETRPGSMNVLMC